VKVAYSKGHVIIPFDSIEFVFDIAATDKAHIEINMRDSRKVVDLIGEDAKEFIEVYNTYLKTLADAVSEIGGQDE
jgi:hypothetical protein